MSALLKLLLELIMHGEYDADVFLDIVEALENAPYEDAAQRRGVWISHESIHI